MTEENKIHALNFILGHLSDEEKKNFENKLASDEAFNLEFEQLKKVTEFIDFTYRKKEIGKFVGKINLNDFDEIVMEETFEKEQEMNEKSKSWIQYLVMALIAILVSVIVFLVMNDSGDSIEEKVDIPEANTEKVLVDSSVTNDKIQSDVEVNDIKIMGTAINRTGFYVIPYSATEIKGLFGSNRSMTNNLPLNVVWDDKELGFAIAAFANENLDRLPSIPYRFSKADYFLGEELFLIHSSSEGARINKGIVIEDSKSSNKMKVHLSLTDEMFGAVLMDSKGLIVGLCEGEAIDGNVIVVKSKALFQMVSEMNMDKGVNYISMPGQNTLGSKSNSQRIEIFSKYVAWFNADR